MNQPEITTNLRMRRYFPDSGRTYERQMASYELLPLFGLKPSGPIPPDFTAEQTIGDTKVVIERANGGRRRVWAQCNACGKWVCAGHLHQHLRSCK